MYTPLYTALIELNKKNQLSFHMPGHMDGRALPGFGPIAGIDTTEVPESDNLFLPAGVIAEAQRAAAAFFGVKDTRFIVNGSSGGILAMVTAVVGDGQKIICDRFCHRSFISALIQSGAAPVWVRPELLAGGAMWGGVDPAAIEAAISDNPDAAAVYITSPNYFGLSSDVEAIADIAHRHGLPLLVDAAHGAHYGLSPLLPPAAANLGADIVVTSAHKTLPALTQSAFMHINGSFPKLDYTLRLHQTSSPSYILMASLDFARALMEEKGGELWTAAAENVAEVFPDQLNIPGRYVKYKDPCRLVLPTVGDPFAAAEELRMKHNISVECCYGGGIVCIVSSVHRADELMRLKRCVDEINSAAAPAKPLAIAPGMSRAAMTPRQAFMAPSEEIPLSEADGRICAMEAVVYPPGTAQLIPGEIIPAGAAKELSAVIARGGEVHGVIQGKLRVVKG